MAEKIILTFDIIDNYIIKLEEELQNLLMDYQLNYSEMKQVEEIWKGDSKMSFQTASENVSLRYYNLALKLEELKGFMQSAKTEIEQQDNNIASNIADALV